MRCRCYVLVHMTRARPKAILLVEDNQDSLLLFRRILQQQGYEVLFARGGEDALKVCRLHTGPLDLVVADVVMPGMSGPQLSERLRSLRPKTPVLFISGIMNASAVQGGSGFLSKPFTPEQLVEKVQQLIGSSVV
jgi:two-component system cell cycle sensor histidine kinase/response regulator CckA